MNKKVFVRYSRKMKLTARVVLLALCYQIIYPNISLALTTGPSQPEVQSFEPVGTTDMVDIFTGDFNYNIPLLDVEGYPVNISYHAGVGMEQEASWVGLGWNINPGVINRAVRGIPDDFKGDTLQKELNIKEEKTLRIGTAFGGELVGVGDPILGLSAEVGTNVTMNNYRGVSVDFSFGVGVNLFGCVSAGVNFGVGSQTGAEIDYNAGIQASTSQIVSKDVSAGVGVNFGQGYSTRTGLKDASFTISTSLTAKNVRVNGPTMGGAIPVAIQNFVPVITNKSEMHSIYARIKIGGEAAWCNLYGNINCMGSRLTYDNDGSRSSYGYLYYQDAAGNDDIMDFTRDRDGMFNKTMQYLPPGNQTYDVYAVSGQGTGGSFRPFRNDFGSVYDPVLISDKNDSHSGQAEASLGWLFGAGTDLSRSKTKISSGPWEEYNRPYTVSDTGSIYEHAYFKQGGELTQVNSGYYSQLNGLGVMSGIESKGLSGTKAYSTSNRDPRANLVYYFNGKDASEYGVATAQEIKGYDTSNSGFGTGPIAPVESFSRQANGRFERKSYHLSEIVQVQTDGRKYIYGTPAMNNVQKEVTFSVDGPSDNNDLAKGLVPYSAGSDDTKNNGNGRDHYYSGTITPAFAHSYLLTSVLSTDYTDVTGDGPTDDDMGSFTKFNYSLKEKDYRWRAPIDSGKAQYNPGYWSDKKDDKANYVLGSREEWMLHSIESKNFIAEFYTSKRLDGKGVKDAISGAPGFNSALPEKSSSYKLDSIKLYNKHDRFINTTDAVPVKTIFFHYDYSLCLGIPNKGTTDNIGKLTLKRIYVKYGNSDKSLQSPYQFEYHSGDDNPDYSLADKDRWGNYKPNNASFTNYEYPFVKQDTLTDHYARAWNLAKIKLPSGGVIEVHYESDDYSYVQDKKAMEMFMVQGVGNSPSFTDGHQLYSNKNSPNLYVYFKRRPGEFAGLSVKDNYNKDNPALYYNFNIELRDGRYEQIKGYAEVVQTGQCSNNADYGYLKLKMVYPRGGGKAHPASYTALNYGRYNLPHILFPGDDPDLNGLQNVLAGLKQALTELISMGKNPITRMLKEGKAKEVNLGKSFIRLTSPGLKKKGGGHRVKSLVFSDSWSALAGADNEDASYGKNYDYTVEENSREISSGVASYEPQIGGDENPFRYPVKYTVQGSNKFPPNDPVDLYQETPIAESLLPSATVGYRNVTVTSIHKEEGRSSQGIDMYQYYTAKDFPFEVKSSALDILTDDSKFNLFEQKNIFEASQGYTIILNDMHGKPKTTEHYVYKPKGLNKELVSYTNYKYFQQNGKLDNNVPVLRHNRSAMKMEIGQAKLGLEMDMTIDTREKKEKTENENLNINVNATNVLMVLIPIPLPFPWAGKYRNEFRSVVATKMIQQYGILSEVWSYNEGALTILRNEAFDPNTGQALITSVNNEFKDKEYSVNYPAYWGQKGMGPSFVNVGYEDSFSSAYINVYKAKLDAGTRNINYRIGDELLIKYTHNDTAYTANGWVTGFEGTDVAGKCCSPIVTTRYPNATPGWPGLGTITNVYIKIVRSGCRNQLGESMESYSTLKWPFDGNFLTDTLKDLISIQGAIYADTATKNLPSQNDWITLNEFAKGEKGQYRVVKEYAYLKDRNYTTGTTRKAGLFNAFSLWLPIDAFISPCPDSGVIMMECGLPASELVASYMLPREISNASNWKPSRSVTAFTPFGQEVENRDAVGNYSSAVFAFNDELPVALAFNARQGEVLAEGFEDYSLLLIADNLMEAIYSPFKNFFSKQTVAGSYKKYSLASGSNGTSIDNTVAHTGLNCFKTTSTAITANFYLSSSTNVYNPFILKPQTKYILSYWIRPHTITGAETSYTAPGSPIAYTVSSTTTSFPAAYKSNIIEGWQKVECVFKTSDTARIQFTIPTSRYVDDIRIYPLDANMKAFVYHPFNEKLMATLDENNFASFYEYDQEGNLYTAS